MPSAQRTITINRPVEEVFAFFSDVRNDRKWRGEDEVREISVAGEMRLGARVHQKLGVGPMGSTVPADMDVVVFQPPTALGFQVITGPLRPRIDFTFTPDGEATSVFFSVQAELHGVKKMMMGSMVQKSMDHAAAALDEAKRNLEAGS